MDNGWQKLMFKLFTASLHAQKLTNDDATDESLLWRLRDPGRTASGLDYGIAK